MLYRRGDLEANEKAALAPYAIKSSQSKGRRVKENYEDERMIFQKDKNRVIHSKAFRRLDQKTQVLMAGTGDHYRTRLTHTLEVAAVARNIARRLGLNEDLCEVIALAHDLGHPPFGHAGEDALNEIMQGFGKHFEHNEQSKRIVETLENVYPDFDGLNLSVETLDGLIKHQTAFDQAGKEFKVFGHLEAQVVNIADEIAYTNHDIDDGIRAGILKLEDFAEIELWQMALERVDKIYGKVEEDERLVPRAISRVVSIMLEDLYAETDKNLRENEINSPADVIEYRRALAKFSERMLSKVAQLRGFLYQNFYMNEAVLEMNNRGKDMIKDVFNFYHKHPQYFPWRSTGEYEVDVKDYIAGMTDGFLAKEYDKISA